MHLYILFVHWRPTSFTPAPFVLSIFYPWSSTYTVSKKVFKRDVKARKKTDADILFLMTETIMANQIREKNKLKCQGHVVEELKKQMKI